MVATVGALLAGGIAGVLARYGAVLALPADFLPWGTLFVNLSGCFLIGLFDALSVKKGLGGPNGRVLLMTGFCGAYTTFSSLILELDRMMQFSPLRGWGYVAASVAAGLALLRLGAYAGGLP